MSKLLITNLVLALSLSFSSAALAIDFPALKNVCVYALTTVKDKILLHANLQFPQDARIVKLSEFSEIQAKHPAFELRIEVYDNGDRTLIARFSKKTTAAEKEAILREVFEDVDVSSIIPDLNRGQNVELNPILPNLCAVAGTTPGFNGPNCWNTALRLSGRATRETYTTPERMKWELQKHFRLVLPKKDRPRFGDLVTLWEIDPKKPNAIGEILHTAVYVGPNLFFGKANWDSSTIYDFSNLRDEFYYAGMRSEGLHYLTIHRRK